MTLSLGIKGSGRSLTRFISSIGMTCTGGTGKSAVCRSAWPWRLGSSLALP